jgi:hypothetical protein
VKIDTKSADAQILEHERRRIRRGKEEPGRADIKSRDPHLPGGGKRRLNEDVERINENAESIGNLGLFGDDILILFYACFDYPGH